MMIDPLANEHDLQRTQRAICQLLLHQSDLADLISRLGVILQPLLPHDSINVIWCDIANGETTTLRGDNEISAHLSVSEVIQQGKPLRVHHANTGSLANGEIQSELLIPLHCEGEAMGVLTLASKIDHDFSPGQSELAMMLAEYIAPVLQSTYVLSRERQQRKRLEALDRIGYAIAASLNIDEVFETFAEQAAQLIRHDAISVTLLAEDGLSLERFAVASESSSTPQAGELQSLDETMAGFVVRSGQTQWSNDMKRDERFRGSNDLQWIAAGFRSFISAPLQAKSRIIGSLNVLSHMPGFYTRADVVMVEQIANAVAIFLDNMYLHSRIRQLILAEERSRIARDIHDTLMQSLTSIILQIEVVERNYAENIHLCLDLRRTRQTAQRALTEARHRIWDLHPRTLTEQPLSQALSEELTDWQQTSGVPARLFVRGEGHVSLAVEVAILRITQEALHNIHKYARAHLACVDLEYTEDDVRILITDDGVGFDPQQPHGNSALMGSGFGLIAMRERAQAAGGHFHVSSWPNNGTRVEASFPLDTHKKAALATQHASHAPMKARVLIVDDHTLIRQGLAELVSQVAGLQVAGTAKDGYEALNAVRRFCPDLVLMDMRLPGMDGAATTRLLLQEFPMLYVIMLTSSDASDDLARAIEAGARGYLLKESSVEQLTETIQAVLRGEAVVERRITRHLFERFNHLLHDRQQRDVLSERELEVLRLMVNGYRNKDIAEALVVSEHTVKSHISSIFQKLGVKDRAGAISTAIQRNLSGLDDSH